MKTKDSLYSRVLVWAFEHDSPGFTRAEIENALKLNEEERTRLSELFFSGTVNNPPLISNTGPNETGRVALTRLGIAAAVDYLDLKEARESSRKAMVVAIIAIFIGIVVGAIQTWATLKA